MIDECEPHIAQWSDSGESFVIKKPEALAAKIIPRYFKHSNFSSFVRQLNFYGFRKIKNDRLKYDPSVSDLESTYWRFYHEKFVRGRTDLLMEMRKRRPEPSPDQKEIECLRREVKSLKSYITTIDTNFQVVFSIVKDLQRVMYSQRTNLCGTSLRGNETKESETSASYLLTEDVINSSKTKYEEFSSQASPLFSPSTSSFHDPDNTSYSCKEENINTPAQREYLQAKNLDPNLGSSADRDTNKRHLKKFLKRKRREEYNDHIMIASPKKLSHVTSASLQSVNTDLNSNTDKELDRNDESSTRNTDKVKIATNVIASIRMLYPALTSFPVANMKNYAAQFLMQQV